ncbi:Uncharacterized membrane protein YphA, DoxX/SURF4 family [Nocardioides terrae]|uniref:Uncharacterized membrane protein YphA, DoxX/SURF4 family n=1 Tax=Nocardioides terrae TaxID=574651 RepID=A0A1I1DE97_9ACTN|nr:DoxX family membrane protein [Nocardioides terrae]SFB73231.1 Uncharacterized membrane protein YphA, DoxX/SURF4 family [Nocardioides terrae]
MTVSRLLARPLLAASFVAGPLHAIKHMDSTSAKAKKVTERLLPLAEKAGRRAGVPVPTEPATWVKINAAAQILGAVGLATGKAPRASSALLALTLLPTTIAGHPFWEETDPAAKSAQRTQFFKNVSLLGGLLIAAGDTNGRPGVAWRARHAAKDARRTARQEARVIKAKAHLH